MKLRLLFIWTVLSCHQELSWAANSENTPRVFGKNEVLSPLQKTQHVVDQIQRTISTVEKDITVIGFLVWPIGLMWAAFLFGLPMVDGSHFLHPRYRLHMRETGYQHYNDFAAFLFNSSSWIHQ